MLLLTTGMFGRLAAEPSIGRAEALRRAEVELIGSVDPRGRTSYAHPYFWAPFVLIGDPG